MRRTSNPAFIPQDMSFIRVIRRVTEKATPIQKNIMVAKQHTFLEIVKEVHGKLSADVYKSFDEIPHNWIKGRADFAKLTCQSYPFEQAWTIFQWRCYQCLRISILLKLLCQQQNLRSTQLKHLSQTRLYLP